MTLVRLTNWKPWEIKAMTRRERRFWVQWYIAIDDRQRMEAVTMRA
jgi:hypothetical protein